MATREHALYRRLATCPNDAAKGGCYLTGDRGACVDTGILVDFEGTLVISIPALQELCEVAGFSFNAEAEKLERDLALCQHALKQAEDEREDLRSQLDAVALAVAHAAAGPSK